MDQTQDQNSITPPQPTLTPQPSVVSPSQSEPTSQTEFFSEQTFLTQPPVIESDQPVEAKPKPWFKTKKVLIAVVGIIGLVLLLIILIAASIPKGRNGILPGQSLNPSPSPALTPYQEKIEALKSELQAADPSKQDEPFPPVLMDISLPTLSQK